MVSSLLIYLVLSFFWCVHVDLKKAHTDLEAMKKQAESTNREYDRLSEENQRLQVSVTAWCTSLYETQISTQITKGFTIVV